MSIQLVGITIEERIITNCRRSYSLFYHYHHKDFVNIEDENLLFGKIFKDVRLFCRQLINDLSNNDNFDRISGPKLRAIVIEVNQDSDWIEDGVKNEVVAKIQNCAHLVFGPSVKIVLEDCIFL